LLERGGLLVVDDFFFAGSVFNKTPKSEKGAGVYQFLERVRNVDGYHKTILPISNGVMFMVKQG